MQLSIYFDPKGFFAQDARVTVYLDRTKVGGGQMSAGFLFELDIAPGAHTIDVYTDGGGPLARSQAWSIELPNDDAPHTLELTHSRAWGNFEKGTQPRRGKPSAEVLARHHAREATANSPCASPSTANDTAAIGVGDVAGGLPDYPVRATWIILAVLGILMMTEFAVPVVPAAGPTPDIQTLDALGALGPTAWRDHEFYRFVTCTFLHGDPLHLAFNAFSLLMGGPLVERKVGSSAFVVLYAACGMGGSLCSYFLNNGHTLSIGASGAIVGIFAAGMVLAEAYPKDVRGAMRVHLARVLVPSLIPIVNTHGAPIDFGAHLGGAIAGGLVGIPALMALKPTAGRRVAWLASPYVKGLAWGCTVVAVVAFTRVARGGYDTRAAAARVGATLIPNSEIALHPSADDAQSQRWAAKYPHDPRTLLWAARHALEVRDRSAFDRALTEAATAIPATASQFGDPTTSVFTQQLDSLKLDRERFRLIPDIGEVAAAAQAPPADRRGAVKLLLERYPLDPRVQRLAAFDAMDAADPTAALDHITKARAAAPAVEAYFDKPLDINSLDAVEGLALLQLHRDTEAAPLIARVCEGSSGERAASLLAERRLCPK